MKVLFLTSIDHPQVRQEAEALSKLLDLDYMVINFNRSDLLHSLYNFFTNFPKILIALMRLKVPPVPPKAFLSYLLTSSLLIERIRGKKYDLIYAHWLYPAGFVGLIISKIINCKIVSVVWGYDIQVIPGIKNYGIGGLNRMISKVVLQKSDLVITNHKVHKVIAEHLLGPSTCKKIVYVSSAIPDIATSTQNELTNELKEKLSHYTNKLKEKKIVLYSPSLRPLYGIQEFTKAIPIVASYVRDCVFIIVGEGELKNEAIKFIKDTGLENKVLFIGRVSYESMKSLYMISTVVCDLAYSGTGTTTLEALCFGKPVIGIRSPRTFIEDGVTGFLVNRGDHESLARYLIEILNNHELQENLSKNARKVYKEKFSMEERMKILLKIFQELLHNDKFKSS